METLVKSLGRFISRDIPFLIGGMSTLLAFLLLIGVDFPTSPSNALAIFSLAVAYPVGFAVQEVVSLSPLVNTSVALNRRRIPAFLRWCFQRWTRLEWEVSDGFDGYDEYLSVYATQTREQTAQYDRTIFLKHIGFAIGSNWLVSAAMLAAAGLIHPNAQLIAVASAALVLSLALLLVGWLHALELVFLLHKGERSRLKAVA